MSKFDRDTVYASLCAQVRAKVMTDDEASVSWKKYCEGELAAQHVVLAAKQTQTMLDHEAKAEAKAIADAAHLAARKQQAQQADARRQFIEALGLDPNSNYGWQVNVDNPQLASALEISAKRLGFTQVFNNPTIGLDVKDGADFSAFNDPAVNPDELFEVAEVYTTRIVKFASPKAKKG